MQPSLSHDLKTQNQREGRVSASLQMPLVLKAPYLFATLRLFLCFQRYKIKVNGCRLDTIEGIKRRIARSPEGAFHNRLREVFPFLAETLATLYCCKHFYAYCNKGSISHFSLFCKPDNRRSPQFQCTYSCSIYTTEITYVSLIFRQNSHA